ncbi:MAG: ATP-dependent RNA helicase HrpA, partial [Verrucomicrobia bacterium]|nr:ATP-dependent RNA helicase HrpA [Verrucomicrobiota bacterium]
RVAALSISRRVAEELGVAWGQEVGAKIRFTDRTQRETRIKFLTDGMLLNEIQRDPLLREYRVVLVDEAHERSLNIDFLLGYLKQLLPKRRDLKVIITSATIDTTAFSRAFGNAPILEVSGRLYPVETRYLPVDELLEESGETTYIDAVAQAVEEILSWNRPGDLLVFLPGEKDIRETRDLLEKRAGNQVELLPLFGRLSGQEQERIFKAGRRRKVILSTNIAETSITIPGIRFVVDSGLARISRYSPHTHTRRLPIEKVAQSSADQRKGRAGRVSEGICLRLYSEEDYNARPRYGTPEILRCNLAEVILRMRVFRLGDIREFPFLDPPTDRAIKSGYQLLVQLGALDSDHQLTALGKRLARLPVDPTVGRMLLEAQREGCVREVLVIAAGLSIQDPRERPMDAAREADAMHARFRHPESDFLGLLKIWEAYHEEMERLSQNQLRKFCRSHFLNYLRMREWRDIHAQLRRSLQETGEVHINPKPAEYEQVHRALLAGLLSGVAQFEEGNQYRAARNRKVLLFPGSTLFRKEAARKKGKKAKAELAAEPKKTAAKWVLCGEFVETSRLYARTVARIEPRWILRVGSHVMNYKYSEPFYEENGERVLIRERVLLYGLEIEVRKRACLGIDPAAAKEIFLREALVEGRLRTRLLFHEANQGLLERLRERQTRLRAGSLWALEERLYQFYHDRLGNVGSVGDLKTWLRDHHGGKEEALLAQEKDLLSGEEDVSSEAFPDTTEINGLRLPLEYAYQPGEEKDGATLRIPVEKFEQIGPEKLDWMVPGYIRQRIEYLLRGLPKDLRKQLFPLNDLAQELAIEVSPGEDSLTEQLARLLRQKRNLYIREEDWKDEAVPEHLRPRVEVVDRKQRPVASGRDWAVVRRQYHQAVRSDFTKGKDRQRLHIWRRARHEHEKKGIVLEKLPELPRERALGDLAGLPVKAWPGLQTSGPGTDLLLFATEAEAREATQAALPALCESSMGRDIGWFQRDLEKELKRVALGFAHVLPKERLLADSLRLLRGHLFALKDPLPVSRKKAEALVRQAKERMRGLPQRYGDLLEEILRERDSLLAGLSAQSPWRAEVDALVHERFLRQLHLSRLHHYPRYLKAMGIRRERAERNPARDREKAQPVLAFLRRYAALRAPAPKKRRLRWLLEEYKVQIFAQELGTDGKISAKILEQAFVEAEQAKGSDRGF